MPSEAAHSLLNDRAQRLLKALVERHLIDGQPVGSRTLARDAGLEISPATIRNVMSDLDHLGLVRSPHTSAGRIPTPKGYRMFVDSLLQVQPLEPAALLQLQGSFSSARKFDADSLLASASQLLSGMTAMAGLVSVPNRDHVSLQQIEFMPLSEQRVLAILVFSDRSVQNRVLETDRPIDRSALVEAGNFLNAKFAGQDLNAVRRGLVEQLQNDRVQMDAAMSSAIHMAEQALEPAPAKDDFLLAGETNLMNFEELGDVKNLRALFETFNRKRDILHLLDRCIGSDGVQIFIGEESGYEVLGDCSVVTAPYRVDDNTVGVLGVIGPTRMAYNRVIPIVDTTARLLSAALNPRFAANKSAD